MCIRDSHSDGRDSGRATDAVTGPMGADDRALSRGAVRRRARDGGRMSDETLELIDRLAAQRVLVVGDVMLDQNLWGQVRRVSPEAPVPVVELERETAEPGGAANNAANAAAVGACAMLGGVVGDDTEGLRLRALLGARNVDAGGLVVETGRPTTTKTRVVAHNQQVVRVDREHTAAITPESEAALL